MLSHFPTAHPDETLYSLCARYYDRVRYPNKKAVPQELFGTTSATAVTDLPPRLDALASRFPPKSGMTADRIINDYTLLPFYRPFLDPEIARRVRQDMAGSNGSAVHMRAGIMAGRVPIPERLRFCPACRTEDLKLFKETYWHRLHQLPGVEVCPDHAVFLEKSDALARHASNPFQFLSAVEFTEDRPARPVDAADPSHAILLKLAADAVWLLKGRAKTGGLGGLRNRYLSLLIERGLASYSGCIRAGKLLGKFRRHCPPPLLKSLRCELSGADQEKGNWLLRLVRRPNHSHHPLRHLLLINFLGTSAEKFFGLPEEIKFFGDSPWPCLNPVADHFMRAVVTECGISFRGPGHRPVGTFRCGCGFCYSRTGPDLTHEDRARISKMKSFGPVWEQALERLWADPALGVSGIARRLGVDPLTVRRHAIRLGLPSYRAGRGAIKPLRPDLKLQASDSGQALNRKRQENRRRWLSAVEENPKISMRSLRRDLPRVYVWLLENDANWLNAHRPARPKHRRPRSPIDWGRRDAKLALAVRFKALELLNAPGRPALVSKTAICNCLGITSLIRQKIQKLPLTADALAGVSESRVEFAVRRVRWATCSYLQEGVFPQRWRLVFRANVARWAGCQQVTEELDSAMEMFEMAVSRMPSASAG